MSQFQVRYEHFKREDTTNSMVINLYDDNGASITPSGSHTWTAKVATDDGYAGEFPVVLSGNDIVLRSSQMTRLPHGQYVLEIWENNNGAVTIYPNAGFIPFEIHKNAPDAIGIVEPTKDINKIIDDLHKAGQNIKLGTVTTGAPGSSVIIRQRLENGQNLLDFTIPRGDKGDKGDKGNPPTLRIGSVTKVAPGGSPTASVTGSDGSYVINLGLPKGDQGTGFAPTRIPSGGNLNSLTTSGVYSSMGGTNFKNLPDELYNKNAFTVMVYGDSNQGSQVIIDPITGIMYTRVARDNWQTWNNWAKVGGATEANLLPSSTMPTMRQGSVQSTAHLSAQRFGNFVVKNETLPTPDIIIKPLAGDTIQQSMIVRTDGTIEAISITFFDTLTSNHNVVPCDVTMINTNTYLISATFTTTKQINLRCLDIFQPAITGASYVELDRPYVGLVQSGG